MSRSEYTRSEYIVEVAYANGDIRQTFYTGQGRDYIITKAQEEFDGNDNVVYAQVFSSDADASGVRTTYFKKSREEPDPARMRSPAYPTQTKSDG